MDYNSKDFIDSLDLPPSCKELAYVLLKSEGQCTEFSNKFLGKNKYIIDDFFDYRENRISLSNITLDKFISMCDTIGKKDAFENVFLQPMNLLDIIMIEKRIKDGKTSLKSIYHNFINNVNLNIMKNVL